jgi:hypothetical protein
MKNPTYIHVLHYKINLLFPFYDDKSHDEHDESHDSEDDEKDNKPVRVDPAVVLKREPVQVKTSQHEK